MPYGWNDRGGEAGSGQRGRGRVGKERSGAGVGLSITSLQEAHRRGRRACLQLRGSNLPPERWSPERTVVRRCWQRPLYRTQDPRPSPSSRPQGSCQPRTPSFRRRSSATGQGSWRTQEPWTARPNGSRRPCGSFCSRSSPLAWERRVYRSEGHLFDQDADGDGRRAGPGRKGPPQGVLQDGGHQGPPRSQRPRAQAPRHSDPLLFLNAGGGSTAIRSIQG